MPFVNETAVNDRHNRPSVVSRVLLRNFFLDDGIAKDPFAIRSVHIFHYTSNLAPNTILGEDGLISPEAAAISLMTFGPKFADGETNVSDGDDNFDEGDYTGVVLGEGEPDESNTGTSGIYNLKENPGEFAVVLDGKNAGNVYGLDRENQLIVQNTASSTGKYIDVWTVKFGKESEWQTVFNDFELFSDTFVSITQPLIVHTRNKLFNKRVRLGSKVDIKVGTEITIQNKDIDESVKNTLKGSAISDVEVLIHKHNDDVNLPSRVLVASSISGINVTSDNTIVYNWDTATGLIGKFTNGDGGEHNTEATFDNDDLGSRTGTYSVQVSYDLFDEHIVSPLFYLIIN